MSSLHSVAFEVSGNGVSTKNADTLAALISSNVDVLPVEVRSVSIGKNKYLMHFKCINVFVNMTMSLCMK